MGFGPAIIGRFIAESYGKQMHLNGYFIGVLWDKLFVFGAKKRFRGSNRVLFTFQLFVTAGPVSFLAFCFSVVIVGIVIFAALYIAGRRTTKYRGSQIHTFTIFLYFLFFKSKLGFEPITFGAIA